MNFTRFWGMGWSRNEPRTNPTMQVRAYHHHLPNRFRADLLRDVREAISMTCPLAESCKAEIGAGHKQFICGSKAGYGICIFLPKAEKEGWKKKYPQRESRIPPTKQKKKKKGIRCPKCGFKKNFGPHDKRPAYCSRCKRRLI